MRRRLALIILTAAMLSTTALGCAMGGRKTHLVSNSPYVDAQTGQLIEEDDDDDGIVSAFFNFLWDAIFKTGDE